MSCNYPLSAFQLEDGSVVFHERAGHGSARSLLLPCGRCAGCRLERSRQWAVRCMHESKLYEQNSFVTLTYDNKHIPLDGCLRYSDFQKFMKRLRKHFPEPVRFYMCGEYGEAFGRPHFHACLFNVGFADKLYFKRVGDSVLYTSRLLSILWPFGHCLIGAVTFESAAYVARYCMQKVVGREAEAHYRRVNAQTGEVYQLVPEFNRMSLRPGIGAPWLERFMSDVYPKGEVVVRGRLAKSPRYYDILYSRFDREDGYERLKLSRELRARQFFGENTEERLAVKEQVLEARMASFFPRSIKGEH